MQLYSPALCPLFDSICLLFSVNYHSIPYQNGVEGINRDEFWCPFAFLRVAPSLQR